MGTKKCDSCSKLAINTPIVSQVVEIFNESLCVVNICNKCRFPHGGFSSKNDNFAKCVRQATINALTLLL